MARMPADIARAEAVAIIQISRAAAAVGVGVDIDAVEAIKSGVNPSDLALILVSDIVAETSGDQIDKDVEVMLARASDRRTE